MTEGRHDMTAQPRLLGGRYQVGELLGYGGMAEVHRGRDLRLGRDVAIKTLRHDLARDATFQMRFEREAQNSASLNHPAIVAVYDTGEERGSAGESLPYIVMEYVNGRTLKEVLAAEGRLMPRRALEIVGDICAALDFSHRHGIIHRDVKPGNIMLTQTGQVKVMDFGIARALASGATTMTQTSAVIGTAQYLSPEQARGEAVDARSDVYATGCVLFELLCGHPPFVGDNPVSVAYQHVREDPRPPSNSNRDVTPDVDAVVLKALAKNPLNRYQSAGEMRGDVMRAAAGRPVSAPPVMSEDEVATMMAAPAPTYRQAPPSRQPARAAQRKKRKGSAAIAVVLTMLGLLAVSALAIGLYLANQTPSVTVPDLTGKTSVEADTALKQAGLTGNAKTQQAAGCTPEKVFEQDPKANQPVDKGDAVNYTVCAPPDQVQVPTLAKFPYADADRALKEKNLTANKVYVASAEDKDTVIDTDPPAGTLLAPGSKVNVRVSDGSQATLPDLSGLSKDQATQRLKEAGFTTNPRFVNKTVQDQSQDGKVVATDQKVGNPYKKSQQITVYIGQVDKAPTAGPTTGSPSPPPGG
jgi:beta-lactam-binding protein with PASTA domain/predicted Ser/Thr protein kinase